MAGSEEILRKHALLRAGFVAELAGGQEFDNPLCGDRLRLRLEGESGRLSWNGDGCSVMLASASLLCANLDGKSRSEMMAAVASLLRGLEDGSGSGADGDLAALDVFAARPARRECALLPWRALQSLLEDG